MTYFIHGDIITILLCLGGDVISPRKKQNTNRINVFISDEHLGQLRDEAAAKGATVSGLARTAIIEHLNKKNRGCSMRVLQGYIDSNRVDTDIPDFAEMVDAELKANDQYTEAQKKFYEQLKEGIDTDTIEGIFIESVHEASRAIYKLAYQQGLIDGIELKKG